MSGKGKAMVFNLLGVSFFIGCALIVIVAVMEAQKQGTWIWRRGRRRQYTTPTLRLLIIAVTAIVIVIEFLAGERAIAGGTIAGIAFGYAIFGNNAPREN